MSTGRAVRRSVTLEAGGTVNVHAINWRCWRDVKESLARLLGSRLLPELVSLAASVSRGDESEQLQGVLAWFGAKSSDAQNALGDVLIEAIRDSTELMELMITGCTEGVDPATLSAADALGIAEAAITSSDVPELIGREKNFWAAALAAATSGASNGTPPTPTGTSRAA